MLYLSIKSINYYVIYTPNQSFVSLVRPWPRKNKSYQAHASTLVETLKTRRAAFLQSPRRAVAARLLQVTKEFKDALEDSADDCMRVNHVNQMEAI